MQLSKIRTKFEALGINVVSMTYDAHADALKFHKQKKLGFPILRDVDIKHVSAFGILEDKYKPDHWAYGIPKAGMFLVDNKGIVFAKFAEEVYTDRPPWDEVLAAAKQMASAKQSVSSETAIDIKKLQADSLQTLVDLIRLDTSQPAGNEYYATDYLKKRLDDAGIESKVFEAETGRANIVARIKGNGTKKPILLLGHTDVVTVERENWTFDPFAGTVSDGKIFGRGATDDKSVVSVAFETLLALKKYNIPLDRDVIFLGVADEEGGGGLGITYMLKQHHLDIDAEFAINEGGRGVIDPETGEYLSFLVGTAEKTPRRARLIVDGTAGHGSIPTRDNAVAVLATAVAKLFEKPLPMRLNETTRTFFTRMAQNSPEVDAKLYRAILEEKPSMAVQRKLQEINPSYFSIIRTSVVPTIFNAGYQRNVIPSRAEATLDIRALPGEDPEYLFEALAEIINDPAVKIIPMKVTRPAHYPAPLTTALFAAFETVLSQEHPDSVILPSMSTGATDSAQLRAAGIPTYGFGPGVFEGENNGIHGNDEYLRLAPFYEYSRLMWLIVNKVAGSER